MDIRVLEPRSFQVLNLRAPNSRFSPLKPAFGISFPFSTKPCGKIVGFGRGLVHPSEFFGLRCSTESNASFDESKDDEFSDQSEELAQKFNLSDELDKDKDGDKTEDEDEEQDDLDREIARVAPKLFLSCKYPEKQISSFSVPFASKRLKSSRHSLLDVKPEPPDWPERTENIERKANSFEIPLSLRLIKMKRKQWERSFREAGQLTYGSVNRAFSNMVFIMRELQTCALSIRESLYSEDLREIIAKMQRETNVSFVWLFQQVFSRTPTLMVYLMILLANFTAYSLNDTSIFTMASKPARAQAFSIAEEEEDEEDSKFRISILEKFSENGVVRKALLGDVIPNETGTEDGTSIQSPSDVPDCGITFFGNEELTDEGGKNLWNSVLGEALRMQSEFRAEALDQYTARQFVSPISVEVEADDYSPYYRTDLSYQTGIAREPNNPLLLSNYGQFLYLVYHDVNRAEACFRRAIQVEPPDPEALCRYADFLWRVRRDLWGAEEVYQQAMAMEPNNSYYSSKYANFLWSSGGDETCFPLDSSNGNFNKVPESE
ncbi:hypothetical protein UlMin_025096 [Ulmus minor]